MKNIIISTEKKIFYSLIVIVCLLVLKKTFFYVEHEISFLLSYIALCMMMPFLAMAFISQFVKKGDFIKIVQKTNIWFMAILIFPVIIVIITLQFNIRGSGQNSFPLINTIMSSHNLFIVIFINLMLLIADKIPDRFFLNFKAKNIKNIYAFYVFLLFVGLLLPLIAEKIFNTRFFIL